MDPIIQQLRAELKANADPHTLSSSQRYFKEAVTPYGIRTAIVNRLAREFYQRIKEKPKAEIFALCEELWRSGMLEESFVACEWSERQRRRYEAEDFKVFERWVKQYVSNWASCDTFCNHTLGAFLERYPSFAGNLKDWCNSHNRWVRRASAVSFILPARKGLFKEDIFEIANILLLDSDDLVQKGYGWMLKSLAEAYENDVYQYVLDRKSVMPRTALRYVIEKMPEERRREAMKRT